MSEDENRSTLQQQLRLCCSTISEIASTLLQRSGPRSQTEGQTASSSSTVTPTCLNTDTFSQPHMQLTPQPTLGQCPAAEGASSYARPSRAGKHVNSISMSQSWLCIL